MNKKLLMIVVGVPLLLVIFVIGVVVVMTGGKQIVSQPSEWDKIAGEIAQGDPVEDIIFTKTERGTLTQLGIDYDEAGERYSIVTIAGKRYDLRPVANYEVVNITDRLGVSVGDTVQIVWQESTEGRREIIEIEMVKQAIANIPEEEPVVATTTLVDRPGPSEALNAFVLSEIGLTSLYPSKWGRVSYTDEPGTTCPSGKSDPCRMRSVTLVSHEGSVVFMVAESADHYRNKPAREAFWGDEAGEVGPDYRSVCQQEEGCSLITSKHGLIFAKRWVDDTENEASESEGKLYSTYQIYSNSSPYYGVILSPVWIEEGGNTELLFQQYVIEEMQSI